MAPRAVYGMAVAFTAAGWLWLGLHHVMPLQASTLPACFFRAVTGIPCPSCGITHSVLHIGQLQWASAVYDNPLGYLAALALAITPVWLLIDAVRKTTTLYTAYNKAMALLRHRTVAIPLIILVIINWAWNIFKYHP